MTKLVLAVRTMSAVLLNRYKNSRFNTTNPWGVVPKVTKPTHAAVQAKRSPQNGNVTRAVP